MTSQIKADKLAASLLNVGLNKNDHIAIWAPNYEFWTISMLAIARAGMACVSATIFIDLR
jgi:acyl-CoA synthetase (AMP-forming)/AMP-acid ligase II